MSLTTGTCSFVLEDDGQVCAFALACHSYRNYCEHLSSTWMPAQRKKHGVDDNKELKKKASKFVSENTCTYICVQYSVEPWL